MNKIRAAITGIAAYVPDYVLTNEELSHMVDTTDEWIMTRIGIKERRILKGEGKGTSDMGAAAVKRLLKKTGTDPSEIDMSRRLGLPVNETKVRCGKCLYPHFVM